MVYNGISATSLFPEEVLQISLDGTPGLVLDSNIMVKFNNITNRKWYTKGVWTDPNDPSVVFQADDPYGILQLHNTPILEWDATNKSDQVATLGLRGVTDSTPIINVVPTRLIPDISIDTMNVISGTLRLFPAEVHLTDAYAEDPLPDLFYLQTTGSPTTPALYMSAGPLHTKTDIEIPDFYSVGVNNTNLTTLAGSLGTSFSNLEFRAILRIDNQDVEVYARQEDDDPTKIWSIEHLRSGDASECGYYVISGTCDPDTGDYFLYFNCGNPKPGTSIGAYFTAIDTSTPSTLITGGTSPNFNFQTTLPIYLYDFDVAVSEDNINFYYGFPIQFRDGWEIQDDGSSEVSIYPKAKDIYGNTMDLSSANSKWRLMPLDNEGYEIGTDILIKTQADSVYAFGTWLNGDDVPLKISSPDEEYSQYTFVAEISSTNGKIWRDVVSISVDSSDMDLPISGGPVSEDGTTFLLDTNPDFILNDGTYVVFDIPDNYNRAYLVNCAGDDIPLGVPVLIENATCVSAVNIGPGTTTIFMSGGGMSGDYYIDSALDLSDFKLMIDVEELSTCQPYNSFSISATFQNDEGDIYAVPSNGLLCWEINSSGNSYSGQFINRANESLNFNDCVGAFNNDVITAQLNLDSYGVGSEAKIFTILARYNDLDNALTQLSPPVELEIKSLPDPSTYGTFFDVISGTDDLIVSTRTNTTFPLEPGTHTFLFQLEDDLPFSYDPSKVVWKRNGIIVASGVDSVMIPINSTAPSNDIEVFIDDVIVPGWGDKPFCLDKKLTFIRVDNTSVDFIAFPKHRFSGENLTYLNFNNYTSSYGNSAYNNGHVETFTLSAEPGFDSYFWKIGDYTKFTNSNITTMDISVPEELVGTSIPIELSAYNNDIADGSFAFTGSTDDSGPLRSHIRFVGYPTISLSASITENYFDLNQNDSEPFTINMVINNSFPSPLKIVDGGELDITISKAGYADKVVTIPANTSTLKYFDFTTLNPSDLFGISPNTYNTVVISISGTVNTTILAASDFEVREQITNKVSIPVTVFNGPFLSISPQSHCVDVGTTVEFKNTTPSFPIMNGQYTDFIFDDGAGNISETETADEPLYGFYEEPGVYSPSLTATIGSQTVIKTFDSLIIAGCGNLCTEYNPEFARQFGEDLKLPHDLNSLMLRPNERLTSHSFNSCIERMMENFNYIFNNCQVYSIEAPTKLINDIPIDGMELDLKFAKYKNKFAYGISNSGNIVVIDFENVEDTSLPPKDRFKYVKNDNFITDQETLVNPVSIDLNSDGTRFAVLDGGTNSIYIYSFNPQTKETNLIIYWGGPGSRSARTKFNSPTVVRFGQDDSLYVLDPESYIIKKYNRYYNWISNIEHPDWILNREQLVSMSMDSDNYLYALTNTGKLYVFDDKDKFINTIQLEDSGDLFFNKFSDGVFYIIGDREIYKYTKFGMKLNKWTSPEFEDRIVGMEQLGSILYVMTNNNIYVAFDCLTLDSIRSDEMDDLFWTLDSMFVNKDEGVQDWVYNDSFSKMYQNIDMLRRSIYKMFITYNNPFDPEKLEYEVLPLHPDDFDQSYISEETFIGINEFVTYDVFNRVISQLHNNMESVLNQVQSRSKNTRIECKGSLCYTWKKMTTNDTLQPNNCTINPLSWVELEDNNITNWYSLSCEDAAKSELELINFDLSLAKNRVPIKIENCEIVDK